MKNVKRDKSNLYPTFSDPNAEVYFLNNLQGLKTNLPFSFDHIRRHFFHPESWNSAVISGQAVLDQAEKHMIGMQNLKKYVVFIVYHFHLYQELTGTIEP